MIIDKLIERIKETDNPSVIGLDTCLEYLPEDVAATCGDLREAALRIKDYNFALIDALKDVVPAVKVQVAYYEAYGPEGMETFGQTLAYARAAGLIAIADVKRNDIGSTAAAYSKAYIGKTRVGGREFTPFESDFVTVNGYLGSDGIKPFVDDCVKYDKGLFALVKTSNPASGELQDMKLEGGAAVYERLADLTEVWGGELIGKYGYSGVGAVIGATHKAQAAAVRAAHPSLFFLIPGYGAQGGTAEDLAVCFTDGLGGIVNSSRGILCAYRKPCYAGLDPVAAALKAALDMKEDLNRYL